MISRRRFLQNTAASFGAVALPPVKAGQSNSDFVASTEVQVIKHGAGSNALGWFHPRACLVPSTSGKGSRVFMTLQEVNGSDFFRQVHFMTSDDLGKTWTEPESIPDFNWHDKGGGLIEGVCDVVPQYHSWTKTVLAMGHNVYYKDNKLTQAGTERWPSYSVRDASGQWSNRQRLVWDDPRAESIMSCGCGERLWFENGDLLVPVSMGGKGYKHRSVTTLRCVFDGKKLAVTQSGSEIVNDKGRGMLEPSVTKFRDRYYMTIRAEDGRGYVTTSDDGMQWAEKKAWAWDDGTPLDMSTTQQHWLLHSEGLHLAYNRKTEQNAKVMRFRAPLFIAAVDHSTQRLRRDTERILFPLKGDPINKPNTVILTDNFHPLAASKEESWITVGENTIQARVPGDLMIGRIHWSKPNLLV
jgi:hypothetical protein